MAMTKRGRNYVDYCLHESVGKRERERERERGGGGEGDGREGGREGYTGLIGIGGE